MKKNSIQKYLILGLVLVAASVVTAAALPKTDMDSTGKLVVSTGGGGLQQSCIATIHPAGCNVTAGSLNTASTVAGISSAGQNSGVNNRHSSGSPE